MKENNAISSSIDTVQFLFSFSLCCSISFISNLVLCALYDDDEVKDMKHEPRWKYFLKKKVVSMTTDTPTRVLSFIIIILLSTRQAIEEQQTEFFITD